MLVGGITSFDEIPIIILPLDEHRLEVNYDS